MDGNEKNGPKRRVWRHLGLRYFFTFFRDFCKVTNDFCSYSGSIYFLQVGMDGDDHNEPKRRARHVVWALGVFFFPFFHVFNMLTIYFLGVIYILKARGGFVWTTMTKTGSNDASGVIWATGTCFSIYRCFFLIFLLTTTPCTYPTLATSVKVTVL